MPHGGGAIDFLRRKATLPGLSNIRTPTCRTMTFGFTFCTSMNSTNMIARIDAEPMKATAHVVRTVGIRVAFIPLN